MASSDPVDLKTKEQLRVDLRASTQRLRDTTDADAKALGVDADTGQAAQALSSRAHDEIEAAAPGVVPRDAYLSRARSALPAAGASLDVFGDAFDDVQAAYMAEAIGNGQALTAQALQALDQGLSDLIALAQESLLEGTKLAALAASAQPVSHTGIAATRAAAAQLKSETDSAVDNLAAAAARRAAARQLLDASTDTSQPPGILPVTGRVLAASPAGYRANQQAPARVGDQFATPQAADAARSAVRRGSVDQQLADALADVRDQVLGNVGHIVLCLAIDSVSTSADTQKRASRAMETLRGLVDGVLSLADSSFTTQLAQSIQEMSATTLKKIGTTLQTRLDALDAWLAIGTTSNATVVSTVDSFGQRASPVPIADKLASLCDLSRQKFCDGQGLLEAAAAIDNATGQRPVTSPSFGRARMVTLAPETTDYTPMAQRPDREQRMILTSSVRPGDFNITARPARDDAVSAVAGLADYKALAGSFAGAYASSPAIGGGAGQLSITGDDGTAETLSYTSSLFDAQSGSYQFFLVAPPSAPHALALIGRAATADRQLLFRPASLLKPAQRFRVDGAVISVDGDSGFVFSPTIAVGSQLLVGADEVPVTVTGLSLGALVINSQHLNGQTDVTLSLVSSVPPPGTTITGILDARARADLGVETLAMGATGSMQARLSVDANTATRVTRSDGHVVDGGTFQVLTTAAPMFAATDAGRPIDQVAITLQGTNGRHVRSTILQVVDPFTVHLGGQRLAGTVSTSGTAVVGVGTHFTAEVLVGDLLRVAAQTATVTAIADDTHLTLGTSLVSNSAQPAWLTAIPSPTGIGDPQNVRLFTVTRVPAEPALDTVSVTRTATDVFVFGLAQPSSFGHGPQDISVAPSVNILPGSLTLFPSTATSAEVRYDPDTVPPGGLTLRARFRSPVEEAVLKPLIELSSGQMELLGESVAYVGCLLSADVYTFTLAAPLTKPVPEGTALTIRIGSVFGHLQSAFPAATWASGLDEWLASMARFIKLAQARLCRMLRGQPADIATLGSSMAAASAAALALLGPLLVAVQAMELGVTASTKMAAAITQARAMGMDQAAVAMSHGRAADVATMTAATSTREGRALVATQAYKDQVILTSDSVKIEAMANQLRGDETAKRLLATARSGFKVAARAELQRRANRARALDDDAAEVAG